MKSALFALALALPLTMTMGPAPAEAKTNVSIGLFFGQPFYSYRVGPDYDYRPGLGWHKRRVGLRDKLTCAEARSLVRQHGYRVINTRDCKGSTYVFRARYKGNARLIYVNARTGGMWRG